MKIRNNNNRSNYLIATLLSAVICIPILPANVWALQVLEEVIVTARKRAESLQETPVAVSFLSGADLAQSGMRDVLKLAEVVPNLTFTTGGSGGSAAPNIRGVGARNNGANFDSGVALYLDGVYASRADGAIIDSVDIRSVQVVRGPQGTLFGKNATGGAIIYATNKPTELFEGNVEVDIGNYDRQNGQITVNVPLIDNTLYSRASLYRTARDGYLDDAETGENLGNVDRWGGQMQLRFIAGDSLLVDLNGVYGKVDQTTKGFQCQPALGVPGSGWLSGLQNAAILIPSTGKSFLQHCQDSYVLDKDQALTPWSDDLPPKYEATTKTIAATVDWEINDIFTLKSITAWRNTNAGEANDIFGLGIPFQTRTNFGRSITANRNTDWYSEELQLSGSAFDQKIDYIVGLFASREETDEGNAAGVAGPFFGALGDPLIASYLAQGIELRTDNKSYAVFSQADWNITDTWRLSLGLRYTWEERLLRRTTYDPDVSSLSSGAAAITVFDPFYSFPDGPDSFNANHGYVLGDDQNKKIDNDDWNPMGSIQYLFQRGDVLDNGTAYFTISTGFLSGGLSESLDFETGGIPEYKPEEATNYEIGLKADVFGNTLRINTALFHTQYDNRQLTGIGVNAETGTISSVTTNAAKSSISGLEIEALWLPMTNLDITFNVALNHGDIEKFEDTTVAVPGELPAADCTLATIGPGTTLDGCNVDRSDEDLPRLPKQTYYAAVQYFWETDVGSFTPRLDATYKKDINNCFDWASCQWENGKGMEYDFYSLNARLTWRSTSEAIRVTAYGNNLTDNRSAEGGNPLIGSTESRAVDWSAPRSYGVELAYTW